MLFFSPTLRDFVPTYFQHVQKKPRSIQEDLGLLGLRETKLRGTKPTRTILEGLGSKRITRITRADIAALHAKWRPTPFRANRAVALLSHIFSVAERLELVSKNPARGIPRYKERHRERYLSREEVSKLGQALTDSPEDRAIRLLLLTGLRPCELYAAKPEHVSERGLRLEDSKVGARTVPIAANLIRLLRESLPFEKAIRGRVSKRWSKLRNELALDGVRLYDLRHSFASHALDAGASLTHIGAILGHSSPSTTSRYAHPDPKTVSRLAEATSSKLSALMDK